MIPGLLYSETFTHNKVVVDTIIFRCTVVYWMLEQAMHSSHQKL
jgi:hypothetical protein